MTPTSRSLRLALLTALAASTAAASDWPQWRGPNRDGVGSDTPTLTALPGALKPAWKLNVGPGHAAPVVAGNTLVYLSLDGGKETAHALDAATGKEKWHTVFDAEPADYSNFDPGPRCAPLVDGDRLYVQSGRGEFQCLSLKDGKKLWGFSFEREFGATWFGNKAKSAEANETASRRHGNNGSSIIDGDRIYVPVGDPNGATLVAFDKKTGKEIWRAGTDNTAYSSLMVGTLAGVKQVIHFTADALMGVEAANGKVLWREPIKTGAKRHTVTPILHGDSVIVSSHSQGMFRFDIKKSGGTVTAGKAWQNKNVATMLSTPVLIGGHLYGLGSTLRDKADFVCVDFNTGDVKWSQPGFADYASIISSGDKLLALNSTGELFLLKANPRHYEELGRLQACGKTYCFPAYVDGKMVIRDKGQLMLVPVAN